MKGTQTVLSVKDEQRWALGTQLWFLKPIQPGGPTNEKGLFSQTPGFYWDPSLSLRSQGTSCCLQKLLKIFQNCSHCCWCSLVLILSGTTKTPKIICPFSAYQLFHWGIWSQFPGSHDIQNKLSTINSSYSLKTGPKMAPPYPTLYPCKAVCP